MKLKGKFVYKGGPGSGHHGHAGRPGKRGGSSSGGIAQLYAGSIPTIKESLASKGWYMRDFHERWVDEGAAFIADVHISKLVPRVGEPLFGDVAPKADGPKVIGILQDWNDGYRHPIIQGWINESGKVVLADGRFRTVAQLARGESTIPMIVARD